MTTLHMLHILQVCHVSCTCLPLNAQQTLSFELWHTWCVWLVDSWPQPKTQHCNCTLSASVSLRESRWCDCLWLTYSERERTHLCQKLWPCVEETWHISGGPKKKSTTYHIACSCCSRCQRLWNRYASTTFSDAPWHHCPISLNLIAHSEICTPSIAGQADALATEHFTSTQQIAQTLAMIAYELAPASSTAAAFCSQGTHQTLAASLASKQPAPFLTRSPYRDQVRYWYESTLCSTISCAEQWHLQQCWALDASDRTQMMRLLTCKRSSSSCCKLFMLQLMTWQAWVCNSGLCEVRIRVLRLLAR